MRRKPKYIPAEVEKLFAVPEDCPKYDKDKPDYRCIANSPYRRKRALEQFTKKICSVESIIEHTLEFLKTIGIDSLCIKCRLNEIDYMKIKQEHQLNSEGHIVWMKFIKSGHLGVVAAGKDVNFGYEKSSGKLIASINKEWDKSFVLLFPLQNITDDDRHKIERGIGNYLISKEVPIIDYYSHNM